MRSPPKHILVVDDNGDVRDVIAALLESYDFRVSYAASGALNAIFCKLPTRSIASSSMSLCPEKETFYWPSI